MSYQKIALRELAQATDDLLKAEEIACSAGKLELNGPMKAVRARAQSALRAAIRLLEADDTDVMMRLLTEDELSGEACDLMVLDAYYDNLKDGVITPDDGTGYYATDKLVSQINVFGVPAPKWASHVAWYNK